MPFSYPISSCITIHFQEKERLRKLICPIFTRLIRGRFELQSIDSGFILKLPAVATPHTKDPQMFQSRAPLPTSINISQKLLLHNAAM